MERTMILYKNYGCLAHEKQPIWTYGGQEETAVCSDKITVEIPEDWETGENCYGQLLLIAPWGITYAPHEILGGGENPCFIAVDNELKKHIIHLKTI